MEIKISIESRKEFVRKLADSLFEVWHNSKLYVNTNDENYTCTTNGAGVNTLEVPFHGYNTFTAYFSTKTTNIRATTDSSKGWVGLSVWK